MTRNRQPDFVCPNCGADVPGGSLSCPDCGSDEQTGWSEETYLDGVSLPDDGEESETPPKGVLGPGKWVWVAVAALLLGVALVFRVIAFAR